MVAHRGQIVELLAELHVHLAVGNIAPRGNVEIVDGNAAIQPRGNMARMSEIDEVMRAHLLEGQFRQDRHAVVALLPARDDMRVAKAPESFERDQVDRRLAFLETEDIGRFLGHQPVDQTRAQPHRVDVPGRDRECHPVSSYLPAAP